MYSVEFTSRNDRQALKLIDTDANTSALVLPEYGFNCCSFVAPVNETPFDFLYADAGFPGEGLKPSHHGTPILAPFPNRIRAGKYRYAANDYVLECNELGKNAIHGFVLDQPWRITATGANEDAWVTGEISLGNDLGGRRDDWPEDFRLSCTYRLQGRTLRTEFEVTNCGSARLPFGLGTHPYFRLPIATNNSLDGCEITSPVSQSVELTDCLPTGTISNLESSESLNPAVPISARVFDDVFKLPDSSGDVLHELRDPLAETSLIVKHSCEFQYIVIYTPPHRKAICIEPYTCVTDAINLEDREMETGLWHLAPGELRRLFIEYEVV